MSSKVYRRGDWDGTLDEFDESLWGCMVLYVEVNQKKELKFMFRGGIEQTIQG